MALNVNRAKKTRADELLQQKAETPIEPVTSVSDTLGKLENADSTVEAAPAAEEKQEVPVKQAPKAPRKNAGRKPKTESETRMGRPLNKDKGLLNRKQCTLTMREDIYAAAVAKAMENDVSFAKYVERAVKEYMAAHEGINF